MAEISIGAFTDMSGLKSISIPGSVVKFELGPFMECYGLESITVNPGNVLGEKLYRIPPTYRYRF